MKKLFTQKVFSPMVAILLVLAGIGGTIGVDALLDRPKVVLYSPEYLYDKAVKDAVTIEPEEILPVVKLEKGNDLVTFNDKNEVLLATWHKYPDSYVPGQQVTLKYGAVWTFTDKEIVNWYKNNKKDVKDWELRFEQLIGLSAETEYTHFTGMWVPLDKVKRPAYSFDAGKDVTASKFDDNADEKFVQWFDSNIVASYFEENYPWTRLGYTYDWADNGTEYGLSEFLVEKDTTAEVEFTLSTQDFVEWLEAK